MKKIVIVMLSAFIASCSSPYSTSGEQLYLKSQNSKGLIVPQPLTDSNVSHFYDLPQQNQNAKVSVQPPDIKKVS